MNQLAAQIIINILIERLCLDPAQIWLRNQNREIPPTKGLWITAGQIDSTIICNTASMVTETVDDVSTQHEINEVQALEEVQIDVFSRSNEAKFIAMKVVAMLGGYYSQQQQELNSFKIYHNPRVFRDTSEAEGGSFIQRYTIVFACAVWYRWDSLMNSSLGDYYDDFTTRADDAATIDTDAPVAEFEITPDTPPPP